MAERLSIAAVSRAYAAGVAPGPSSPTAWPVLLKIGRLTLGLQCCPRRSWRPMWRRWRPGPGAPVGCALCGEGQYRRCWAPNHRGLRGLCPYPLRVGAGGAGPYQRRRHSPRGNPSGSVCDGPRGHPRLFGPCLNSVDPAYLSGGSSSGSAVALGRGHVAFSLGTDTAGSGRVPAAFNGLYGFKPSWGLLSTKGVVPACESLDCVSIFAPDLETLAAVAEVAGSHDPADVTQQAWLPGLRPVPGAGRGRLAVPLREQVALDGAYSLALWDEALAQAEAAGFTLVPFDAEPLLAAGRLLYEGPWVAERYAVVAPILESAPSRSFP